MGRVDYSGTPIRRAINRIRSVAIGCSSFPTESSMGGSANYRVWMGGIFPDYRAPANDPMARAAPRYDRTDLTVGSANPEVLDG